MKSQACVLKLYVTGKTAASLTAIDNLERICRQDLRGACEMVVIDVLQNPEKAEEDRIMATPTLLKESPPPVRRILGDLSDSHAVVLGLNLT